MKPQFAYVMCVTCRRVKVALAARTMPLCVQCTALLTAKPDGQEYPEGLTIRVDGKVIE